MKNLQSLSLVVAMLLALALFGCASQQTALPKADGMSGLKGQTSQQVLQQFGQPDTKRTDSSGNQVWEYRRPAAEHKGMNTVVSVLTWGMDSGSESQYVDIMILTFSHDRVANFTFSENVGRNGRHATETYTTPVPTADPAPANVPDIKPTVKKTKK